MPVTLETLQEQIHFLLETVLVNQGKITAQEEALKTHAAKIQTLEGRLAAQIEETKAAQRFAPLFVLPEFLTSNLLMPLETRGCYGALSRRLEQIVDILHAMPFHPHSILPMPDLEPLTRLLTMLLDIYEGLAAIQIRHAQQYFYELYVQLSGQDSSSPNLADLLESLINLDLVNALETLSPNLDNIKAIQLAISIRCLGQNFKDAMQYHNNSIAVSMSGSSLVQLKSFPGMNVEGKNQELVKLIDRLLRAISAFYVMPDITCMMFAAVKNIHIALLPQTPFKEPSPDNDRFVYGFFNLIQEKFTSGTTNDTEKSFFQMQLYPRINKVETDLQGKISGVNNAEPFSFIAKGGWMALSLFPFVGIIGIAGMKAQDSNKKMDRHFLIIAARTINTMLEQLPAVLEEVFKPFLTAFSTGVIGAKVNLQFQQKKQQDLVDIITSYLNGYISNMNSGTANLVKFTQNNPADISAVNFHIANFVFELLHFTKLSYFRISTPTNTVLRQERKGSSPEKFSCILPENIVSIYPQLCGLHNVSVPSRLTLS